MFHILALHLQSLIQHDDMRHLIVMQSANRWIIKKSYNGQLSNHQREKVKILSNMMTIYNPIKPIYL